MDTDYRKELQKLMRESEVKDREIGVLTERNRIMDGLDKADLPLGVWTLIKDIINPPKHEEK